MDYADRNSVDVAKLQQIQDSFSEAAHLFAFCVDANGRKLTHISGNREEAKKIVEMLSNELLALMLDRIMADTPEEQVIEETMDPNVLVAGISIKVQNVVLLNWIILGVVDNPEGKYSVVTTRELFDKALDFIRIVSKTAYSDKLLAVSATAESRKYRLAERKMSESLAQSEAMTDIVQMLESDDGIESILSSILKEAQKIVTVSHAYVIRSNHDHTSSIVGEHFVEGQDTVFPAAESFPVPEYLEGVERTVAISSKTRLSDEQRISLHKYGIYGIAIMPITINGRVAMHVCFMECRKNKIWELQEIKFLNDVTKIIQNILIKRIQKNSLASSFASLEAILDNVGSGIYVKDKVSDELLFTNRVIKQAFSDELEDGTLFSIMETALAQEKHSGNNELFFKKTNRWYDLHQTEITWVDGRSVTLYAIYDITDKKVYQAQIEQQANNDFLTGLYNRMCCEKDLQQFIQKSLEREVSGALFYLDLDDFKHINDGLGHQYGDVLLKAIAHSLQRVEGIEDTCYRMGGDEFVIIVPPEEYSRLDEIMDEIKSIFEKPWFLKGADYYCTMSMGIVTFPDEGRDVQDLMKKADIAMYEAKRGGKNQISRFAQESDLSAYRRLDLEKNMRTATSSLGGFEEFVVYYQPVVDIQKPGTPCVGAEALVRWNNTELGFMSPADFIPLAEYLGLINPIGNYVLRKACEDCRFWNENGHPYYKVNVNLSVVQLLQNDIVESIKQVIDETGINPKNLTLEVTESLAINDMSRMKEIIRRIRGLGARIALDDFGTGYSSLNHIREIPLDVIKVDQSFVRDLAVNQYSQSFIKMVSELAEAIGVRVCVEGIETESQYNVLKGMKVRMIQGYYFNKPMPLTEFERKYVFNHS